MQHPDHLAYGRTMYVPRRQPAVALHAIGRAVEGLLALAIIVALSLGCFYIFGVVLGAGVRFGYALLARVF